MPVYEIFTMGSEDMSVIDSCNCLTDCDSIEYEFEVIKTKQTHDNHWKVIGDIYEWVGATYYGSVVFSFGDTEYRAFKRYENYGTIAFLSNVGGLLGLFLGVSVISFIEIFYFIFIRVSFEVVMFIKMRRRVQNRVVNNTDLSSALRQMDF